MLMYKQQGFNLVELMAVVIIIGIISAVAYPSYTNYVERANRSEGQAFLLDVAAKQERYRSQNNEYADSATKMSASTSSETGKYGLAITIDKDECGYMLTDSTNFNDSNFWDI